MTEVVIHRCTLRVVRRGGWSWGPDPQGLLRGAVNALPQLLGQALNRLGQLSGTHEISAPLRINIPIQLHELRSMPSSIKNPGRGLETSFLSSRINHALTNALAAHGVIANSLASDTEERDTKSEEDAELHPRRRTESSLVELLLLWLEQGGLEDRLSKFSVVSLETWHRRLMKLAANGRDAFGESSGAALSRSVEGLVGNIPKRELDRPSILRHRIAIAVRAMSTAEPPKLTPALRDTLDRVLPLPLEATGSTPSSERLTDSTNPAPAKSHQVRKSAKRSKVSSNDEIAVASVLPFLLLGPLSRIGYLQTLAATLEAAELRHLQSAFATALAYKVLDPPERGWLRQAGVLHNAATFGGLAQPLDGEELHGFARAMTDHLSPLDSVLCVSLVEGHSPTTPLLLQQCDDANVLFDVDGLFPISSADHPEKLFPILFGCPSSVVLIPAAIAAPGLLRKLDAAGHRFVTDAPPTRGERWRRLSTPRQERWWTNDEISPATALVKSAQRLEQSATEAAQLLSELCTIRPIVRTDIGTDLDRHLSLAAAIALGTISWTLWNHREPTNPLLALQRFSDLDGTVRFTPDCVRVRLPMGRRFQDLHEHRLLEDVADVPWFDERVLQFSGG